MKLVFIIDNEKTIGGGDYAQFKYAEALAQRGHQVTIFAQNYNEFIEDLKKKNLNIIYRTQVKKTFKGARRINDILSYVHTRTTIEKSIKKEKPDAIIGYSTTAAVKTAYIAKKYSIPSLSIIFETPEWLERRLGKRFQKENKGRFKKIWKQTKKAYEQTDHIIPNSYQTQKECQPWLIKKIEDPIYPGIVPQVQKVKKKSQIIYTGRLSPYKNVDILIQAVSKMKNPPHLCILGSGEQEEELKELAEQLKVSCTFTGRVTDKKRWKLLQESELMVFPTSFEGFGMPPGEALSVGVPCICTDIPVLKEIYQNNVIYIKERNISQLTRKLNTLFRDKKKLKEYSKKGKAFIKRYTWQKAAQEIERRLKT